MRIKKSLQQSEEFISFRSFTLWTIADVVLGEAAEADELFVLLK